jgi:hypothetical protein
VCIAQGVVVELTRRGLAKVDFGAPTGPWLALIDELELVESVDRSRAVLSCSSGNDTISALFDVIPTSCWQSQGSIMFHLRLCFFVFGMIW